jgi:hypothetical protein
MGKIDLRIKANLENVTEVFLSPDEDWYFEVSCTTCGEAHDKKIYFVLSEVQDMQGSKGQANFVMKCKSCDRTNNIEYLKNTHRPYSSENESWETIASFDCRGWSFIAFHPGNSFGCKGVESSTPFGSPHG